MADTLTENNIVVVRDTNISAFLLCLEEVRLVKTERDKGTVLFYFAPKEKVEEFIATFWSDTAPAIQPRKLFGAQRDLKNLIFSEV